MFMLVQGPPSLTGMHHLEVRKYLENTQRRSFVSTDNSKLYGYLFFSH